MNLKYLVGLYLQMELSTVKINGVRVRKTQYIEVLHHTHFFSESLGRRQLKKPNVRRVYPTATDLCTVMSLIFSLARCGMIGEATRFSSLVSYEAHHKH